MNQRSTSIPIENLRVSAYTIPTDQPEADGTIAWDSTTLVLVEVYAGGKTGIGYSYADRAASRLIDNVLANVIIGKDAFSKPAMAINGKGR